MADIELVIKLSKEDYKRLKEYKKAPFHSLTSRVYEVIANGTPLPEGHGDLVDYEELKNNTREYGAYAEATLSHIKPKIIIEADVEG